MSDSKTSETEKALVVTPEFKTFIKDIVRKRCKLKEKLFKKYFDNEESWNLVRQAFIHKSLGMVNYELLEFEGDVVLNMSAVQYLRMKFPKIINVAWNTRLKHTLISSKVLADIAIKNGFTKFISSSKELYEEISKYPDKKDSTEFMAMNEDTVEALCGAITRIINNNAPKSVASGISYQACYNMISSFLDEIKISIKYEDVFDAKSRLKALFDIQQWSSSKGCTIGDNLKTYNLQDPRNPALRDQAMNTYMRSLERGMKLDENITNTTDRFLTMGYVCLHGDPYRKTFISAATSNRKLDAEKKVCEKMIDFLKKRGIWIPPSDPYEVTK